LRHIEMAVESVGLFWALYIHNLFGIAKAKLAVFSRLPEQFTGQCFSQELEFHFALI
jgi:hypothetical protein